MARAPITKANPYTPQSGKFAGRTFNTERQYRDALAQTKGFRNWTAQQQSTRKVRSASDIARLRSTEQEARSRALNALSIMRTDGLSLRKAAKASGTTVNTVKRHAGSGIEKSAAGRYQAKGSDRISRALLFPTESGLVSLNIRDSRSSSRLSAYWTAVRDYIAHGKTAELRKFRGKTIRVENREYTFITDPETLNRLYDAGELTFDDIYGAIKEAERR